MTFIPISLGPPLLIPPKWTWILCAYFDKWNINMPFAFEAIQTPKYT